MKKLNWLVFFFLTWSPVLAQTVYKTQWPSFRGPSALGFIENCKPPTDFNIENGKNIRWKTTIPGLGHSSPVIWNDRLFVTSAVSGSGNDSLKIGLYGDIDNVPDSSIHEFKVYCLDKNTGKIIWERLAAKGVPKTKRHTKASHANCTPATNGKYLVVFFGSEGLYCYDLNGNLIWKKDLGKMNAGPFTDPEVEWGFASSPIIHNGKIIIQCDFIGNCFLASFDAATGNQIWRTQREEVSTWSTPTVFEKDGKTQIVVNGWKHIGGYDFETGREIWKMSGGGDAPTPTPVFENGLIYINSAHGKFSPIYAIEPDAVGDITLGEEETTNKYIPWSIKRGGAYMQTPLIYEGYLYNLQINGLLTVFEAKTGKEMYRQSHNSGGFTASCIAADGKVWFCAENGETFVIKAGPEYKLLAKNNLGENVMATPALSGNIIYFRTQKSIIAIGNPD